MIVSTNIPATVLVDLWIGDSALLLYFSKLGQGT